MDEEKRLTLLENLYIEISQIIGTSVITTDSIFSIVVNIMQLVENYKELTGQEKKDAVILVIERVIEEHLEVTEGPEAIKFFLKFMLPKAIDTIISLDKSEIVIKTKKCCKKMWCCC